MSAEPAALTRSWIVGHRTCTLTMPRPVQGKAACAVFEWSPNVPRQLSATEWHEYRRGRNAAITELAQILGINAAVLEV